MQTLLDGSSPFGISLAYFSLRFVSMRICCRPGWAQVPSHSGLSDWSDSFSVRSVSSLLTKMWACFVFTCWLSCSSAWNYWIYCASRSASLLYWLDVYWLSSSFTCWLRILGSDLNEWHYPCEVLSLEAGFWFESACLFSLTICSCICNLFSSAGKFILRGKYTC